MLKIFESEFGRRSDAQNSTEITFSVLKPHRGTCHTLKTISHIKVYSTISAVEKMLPTRGSYTTVSLSRYWYPNGTDNKENIKIRLIPKEFSLFHNEGTLFQNGGHPPLTS